MQRIEQIGYLLAVAGLCGAPAVARAQGVRVRPPSGSVSSSGSLSSVPAASAPGLVPVTPEGNVSLGIPSFDPYTTTPLSTGFAPAVSAPAYSPYASTPAPFGTPAPAINVSPGAPPAYPPAPAGGYGAAAPFGSTTPNSLFPNGIWSPGGTYNPAYGAPLRLLQNPRLEHTFLYGNEDTDVAINDTEVAVTAAFPNFLFTGQPVYVSPTFVLHLWDGPQPPSLSDLPPQAYSGMIEAAWKSDPNRVIGGDVAASVGVHSDFNTVTTDSIRVQGTGLVTLRLTPTMMLKGGVTYLDRLRVKLLPAGGIYWEPNPQTKYDIYFPRPKLAHYWTTVGNTDVWVYVAGEYGGGNWTIEDPQTNASERVDINDIRVMGGIEWFSHLGPKGFFEGGYVFDREVLYEVSRADNFRPDDTFMVRGGISY